MSTEPRLPELKETDATGRIAEIYDDIRYSLRVPMVNLIFRHMATIPGCLEWAWANIGPLYVSGKAVEAAAALMAEQRPPRLGVTAAEAAQAGADVAGVRGTCDAYGRANPANLLALKALDFIIDETRGGFARRKPMRGVPARAEKTEIAALPAMAALNTLPPETAALLEKLAHQMHGGDNGVIPSFYRHFAAWPKFLALLHRAQAPAMEDIFAAAEAMERAAHGMARVLYLDSPAVRTTAPSPETITALKDVIGRFPVNLCRMTLTAHALDAALAQ